MKQPLAIVTGTTRGLGLAVARGLLERGWRVIGIARGTAPSELDAPAYRHLAHDLTDLEGLEARLAELRGEFDPASAERLGLVNNAAMLAIEATHELTARNLAQSFAVGVTAPAWLMGWALRAAPTIPLRIVNVSSGAATRAYPGWSAYCQSKAALDMAGAVLAEELGEVPALMNRDVAVVSYSPGVVDTAMQEQLRAADESSFPRKQRFVDLFTSGELVRPEEPALEIVEFLVADAPPPFSRRRLGDSK